MTTTLCVARQILVAVSVLVMFSTPAGGGKTANDVRYACEVSTIPCGTIATIRGAGQISWDGFVMGDYTCPLATRKTERLPLSILVDVQKFSSPADEAVYHQKPSDPRRHALFQVVVRGKLECKDDFRFHTNEDGEFIGGNGYGELGLMKYRIKGAEVLDLYKIE